MQNFPGMSREAALILGAVAAVVNGIVTVAGLGGFEDGLQWADLVAILAPLGAALGTRHEVYSRETVEAMGGTPTKRGGAETTYVH